MEKQKESELPNLPSETEQSNNLNVETDSNTPVSTTLVKNHQDFNQTTHVGPQEPIVFGDNINLYLNCLGSMKDVLKWSCHSHIMLFSVTSQCMLTELQKFFCNKTTSIFLSRKHTISRMN